MLNKLMDKLEVRTVEALNKTSWSDLYKAGRIKTASISKTKEDYGDFNLQAAIKEHPDHLFVKIFAIKKDEVNDNGDAFSESELKKAAHTFIGVPIFTNHQNDDIEKAKGKCVHAWYDEEDGGIYIISAIDSVAYPRLARGIAEKFIMGTSMGASVDYSVCSICHNKAAVADEYCQHIKERKNKKFSGTIECNYHKSKSDPTDDCPICGKKSNEQKSLKHTEAQTHEWNFNVKFIEDSFVVNPACHDCLVCDVLNADAVNRKIASLRDKIETFQKEASCDSGCSLEKYAGQRELTYLTDVMNKIEVVAKSMMAQKKYVSMEYVSNIVDVLASLQSVTDELTEMGYGQVPSPDITAVESVDLPKTSEEVDNLSKTPQNQAQPGNMQALNAPIPQMPPAGQPPVQSGPAGTQTEQIGGLGSVTKPKFSQIIDIKKKEFLEASSNLIDRLESMQKEYTLAENQNKIKVEQDKEFITMANEKTGTEKDSATKVAASPQAHSTDVITEKQLDEAKFTGERTENPPTVILEKRLDNKSEAVNDTTSESPQTRSGSYETITEKQLASVKSGYVVRWNDYPEVITEKQWTDMSRLVGSVLSESQDNRITEKQLADFTSKHRYVTPTVIQEKQLNSQSGDLSHYAYNADALVKAAAQVISDAIAFYGKTPAEIKSAASKMNDNISKAAMLTLVNALPHKAENRETEKSRFGYFSKLASATVATPDAIDALVTSMSEHIGDMSADDLVETIYTVASSQKSIAAIEEMAKDKLAKGPKVAETFDKKVALKKALAGLNKSDDGRYEVTFENGVGIDPTKTKKSAFVKHVFKCASKQIAEDVGEKINVAILDIKVAENGDVVTVAKDVDRLTAEEKESWQKVAGDWGYMAGGNIDDALPAPGQQQAQPMAQPMGQPAAAPAQAGMKPMSFMKDDEDDMDDDFEDDDFDIDDSGFEDEDEDTDIEDEEIDDLSLGIGEHPELEDGLLGLGGLGKGIDLKIDLGKDKAFASSKKTTKKASREQTVKEAQLLGGEMGGQAGASQAPGAGATMPQPPAGGAPLESFEQSDLAGEFEDDAGDQQPKPPGSMCPVCGSEDVDIIKGQGKCNNCSSEMRFKIDVEVTKWAGLTGDEETEDEEGGERDFELPSSPTGGEAVPPAPAPAAPAAGGAMPAAASTKNDKVVKTAAIKSAKINKFASVTVIKPEAAKKLAEMKVEIGSVSPITGTTNTVKIAKGKHLCLDTGICYEVEYALDANDPKKVYAQFSWKPQDEVEGCSECRKAKIEVMKALESKGVTEESFDAMAPKERGDLILSLRASGAIKRIKTSSSESTSIIKRIKEASVDLNSDKFPMESCVERIARRYGEDALAISGPCEGKKLADCVCKSLKKAGVYSNGLAVKVADIWREKDASMECLEDFVREGFELKEAAAICETMKAKYASIDDKFAQEVNEIIESEEPPMDETPPVEDGGDMVQDFGDEDPFETEEVSPEAGMGEDAGISEGIETDNSDPVADALVNLVKALGKEEEVDSALDTGLGENPAEEEHHEESAEIEVDLPEDGSEEVDIEVPGTASEEIGASPEGAAIEIEDEMAPMADEEDEMNEMKGGNIENKLEDLQNIETTEEVGEELEETGEELEEKGEEIEENAEGKEKSKLDQIKEIINGKEGDSEEESNEDNAIPGVMNPEENEEKVEKEGDDMDKEAYTEDEAAIMRHGYVGRTDEMNHLDFSKLASMLKGADAVKSKPAQDNVPFKYKGKSTIGDESAFDADKPDVPNKGNSSKMGDEQPPKGETANIPTADARIDGEKDNKDIKPELDDTATGGENGQGTSGPMKAANTKDSISRLAEAILAQTKTKRKFVQDDEDVKPYSSGNGFIGDEKESIGEVPAAKPAAEQNVPRADAFIGNEKDSIGEKPSEKNMPSIPTSDARIDGEKDNDKIKSEKTDEMTGNLQNNVSAKSKARSKEATRIAGRMLQAGKISVDELSTKIAQLERYEVEQLKDLEKGILDSQKGLKASSDGGIEQPIIIREASNQPKPTSSRDELANALTSMMSLARANKMAQEDEDIQLRQAFKYGNRR